MSNKDQEVEIDLMQLFGVLLKKSWAIILAAVIFGGCTLLYTVLFVTPLYKARTLMYVNNNALNVGDVKMSISAGDLSAAQSLVDTYTVILGTRSTLDEVNETAGLNYEYEELHKMISAASVNSTEIFYVEVTNPDPKEAELIANTIGQILPERIASIVEGSSARIVDYAVVPAKKASPSFTKNTVLGALVGIVVSCGIIIIRELMNDEIRDSKYLEDTFDIPVLAVVPELTLVSAGSDYYQYGYGKSRKGEQKNGKK